MQQHTESLPAQQNLSYVVQELANELLEQEGVVAAEVLVGEMARRFPDISGIQQQQGSRFAREISRLVKANEFDAAHDLLSKHPSYFRYKHQLSATASSLYYKQAKPHMDDGAWPEVINIFTKGHTTFPDNRKLRSNLEYAWISSAKRSMKAEAWSEAAAIYRKAAKALPSSIKIRNNLNLCERKLEAAK